MSETRVRRRQRARGARGVHRPRAAPRRPRGVRRPDAGPDPQQAVRRARPDRRRVPGPGDRRGRPRRGPRAGARGRVVRGRGAGARGDRLAAREHLRHLLVPRDPDDDRDVILEVKAGEGGEESALFAGDLLRMYLRYAEKRGWRAEVTDATESDLGGYKEARLTVKAKGTPQPGEAPWAMLKFEGGVHRVQRVPVTESQGRIHTSAAGRARHARGRGDRRGRDPPERHPDRRLPLVRTRRPERQHDRLRGPDHPPADRHRRVLSEREVAAAEQGGRPAGAPRAGCTRRPRSRRRPRRPPPAAARSGPSTAASGSAPTTSPRTG